MDEGDEMTERELAIVISDLNAIAQSLYQVPEGQMLARKSCRAIADVLDKRMLTLISAVPAREIRFEEQAPEEPSCPACGGPVRVDAHYFCCTNIEGCDCSWKKP